MRTFTAFSKALLATAIGGTIILAGAGMASAHASIPNGELAADGYGQISVRVPHGCEGAPTNVVEVQIPDGFSSIKPQAKAGWTVETEMVELAEPIELHGNTITERVGVVRWKGGSLPDSQYDDFGITLKAPDAAGTTAAFPTIQYCENASVEWIGEDAPMVKIVAGTGGGHGAESTEVGDGMTGEMTGEMTELDTAVAEAVAAANAEQAASIEALTERIDAQTDGGESSSMSIVALLAGLSGLGLGAAAFANRKR